MPIPTTPAIVTDCVIVDQDKRILLVKRKNPPFEGQLALPGGCVDVGETVEDGCRREVREETSVEVADLRLVGVYSDPHRDPRGHIASNAFLTTVDQAEAMASAGKSSTMPSGCLAAKT